MAKLSPLSLTALNSCVLTYEGRDKLLRIFQFGARAIMGFTAKGTERRVKQLNEKARLLMTNLAGARRAFRWGRDLHVHFHGILTLTKYF